jgi:hypothetical protein
MVYEKLYIKKTIPLPKGKHEFEAMKENATSISFLYPA